MDEVKLAIESYHLIVKDFGLEEESGLEEAKLAFDWLEKYLTNQIKYLLDYDFPKFLNALYRIDIPEEIANAIFSSSNNPSNDFAKAMIERQKQKVLTRQQFRQRE